MLVLLTMFVSAFAAGFSAYIAVRVTEKRNKEETARQLKRRTALVRAASHELRTPLNDILGFTAKLKKEIPNLSAQGQKGFRELTNSSSTLHKKLLDIIDIFDLPEKNIEIASQPVNVSDVTSTLMSAVQKQAREKFPDLTIKVSVKDNLWVKTDVVRLRQCLSAIIRQSVVQTKNGSISVDVKKSPKRKDGKSYLTFAITDTSPGMDQWAAQKYFVPEEYEKNPFLRGRPSAMLSLNLAKGLAEIMGGTLEVTSTLRKGVTFTLRVLTDHCEAIPQVREPEPEAAQEKLSVAEQDVVDDGQVVDVLAGARILVVDDNETNQIVLETFLELFGATDIETVSSGLTAIDAFQQKPFDLIFMDIQMPELDGVETSLKIKELGPTGATVPIVAVSAGTRMEHEPRCKAAGIDDYIEKPIAEEALFDAIMKVAPRVAKSGNADLDKHI